MFHVQLDACRPSLAPIAVKLETAVGQTIPDGGRRAAERFQVAVSTAARCAGRYRDWVKPAWPNRSSRPHRSSNRTDNCPEII
jgi:hypothetical protein